MFEEELAVVEESFRGLGRAREGVSVHGGRADSEELTEVLLATERLRRVADALELAVVGEASRWGEERGPDGLYRPVQLPRGQVAEFAPEAVAAATHMGTWAAGDQCELAARAVTDLKPLADLVAEGRIPVRTVKLIAKETRKASPAAVAAVLEHLLAQVRGKPGSIRIADFEDRELRKATRRIIERVEPELLADKAARNREELLDVRFASGPVGCSDMYATLPTEAAAALKEAIEAAALLLRQGDPEMTTGVSRAHALADLALRGVEVSASVRLGVPIIVSAASRLAFAPFEGGKSGSPASHPARSPGDSTPGEDLHGPTSREGRFVTGEGADAVDVIPEEWAGGAITAQVPATCGPGGQATWTNGCEIPGVGFIPADVVSALVSNVNTRVSSALLDARTGVLVETSNPRYVVPDSMREFIATRDGTCRMWGCTRKTMRAGPSETNIDIDHATAWPAGETTPANLSGLCRHHHRMKQTPGWKHVLTAEGVSQWTSPDGILKTSYPEQWVHTDDEDQETPETAPASPPVEGASDLAAEVEEQEVEEEVEEQEVELFTPPF